MSAFVLFFVLFAIVAVILIAKVRSDAKQRGADAPATLPDARLAGTRRRRGIVERILEPGAYAYALGICAVLSALLCGVLAYIQARPTPPHRRTYRIVDPINGTVETRDLTERELHEQYESVGETLRAIQPNQ